MWKEGSLFLATSFVLFQVYSTRPQYAATMAPSDFDPLDHSELISISTEPYRLLDILSAIPPGSADFSPICTDRLEETVRRREL